MVDHNSWDAPNSDLRNGMGHGVMGSWRIPTKRYSKGNPTHEQLVGGLEPWNFEWLSRNSWEFHHPNWRTHSIIFQRGRLKPPTRTVVMYFSIIFHPWEFLSSGLEGVSWARAIHLLKNQWEAAAGAMHRVYGESSRLVVQHFRFGIYPLVNKHSYWKWPFIVDLPIENDDFP